MLETLCDPTPEYDCTRPARLGSELHVGDLTGDGLADVLVGAPTPAQVAPELGVRGSAIGRAYVLSQPFGKKP